MQKSQQTLPWTSTDQWVPASTNPFQTLCFSKVEVSASGQAFGAVLVCSVSWEGCHVSPLGQFLKESVYLGPQRSGLISYFYRREN